MAEPRSPHVIRLRGPWIYQILESADGQSGRADVVESGSCSVPAHWRDLFAESFSGRVRFQRNFGCPTGLATGAEVRLIVHGFDGIYRISLNDFPIGAAPFTAASMAAAITEQLRSRNVLAVDVLVESRKAEDRIGEARLEIVARSQGA